MLNKSHSVFPLVFHAFRPDISSTLDTNLVKPLELRDACYMVCLVSVKDDGVLVTTLEPT